MLMPAAPVADPPSASGQGPDEGYLAWTNIAHQTGAHLLAEGQRLPTETRIMLARIRDHAEAMGEAARARLVAGPAEAPPRPGAVPAAAAGALAALGDLARLALLAASLALLAVALARSLDPRPPARAHLRLPEAAPHVPAIPPAWQRDHAAAAAPAAVPDPAAAPFPAAAPGPALAAPDPAAARAPAPAAPALPPLLDAPVLPPLLDALPGDPLAAVAAETALGLGRRARALVQRRLGLLGHPLGQDGVFGPRTRAAIARWQEATGRLPTGHLDREALRALEAETETLLRAGPRRTSRATPHPPAPAADADPAPSPGRCVHDAHGRIAWGGGFACDLAALADRAGRRPEDGVPETGH